ncbi:MAG: hypothetical protein QF717_15940, partial [SAR202 cluster bacterium]|nr:hypothetical protein [SAR202 cluster bacterium]
FPQLWNQFSRLTLVDFNMTERVTIDLDLDWSRADSSPNTSAKGSGRCVRGLTDFCIIEVKRDGRGAGSVVTKRMREGHVHPTRFFSARKN